MARQNETEREDDRPGVVLPLLGGAAAGAYVYHNTAQEALREAAATRTLEHAVAGTPLGLVKQHCQVNGRVQSLWDDLTGAVLW
jgi:hypothetical protein